MQPLIVMYWFFPLKHTNNSCIENHYEKEQLNISSSTRLSQERWDFEKITRISGFRYYLCNRIILQIYWYGLYTDGNLFNVSLEFLYILVVVHSFGLELDTPYLEVVDTQNR